MTLPVVHLVDDDVSFLRATARMLRASGYRVSAHESARQLLDDLHAGDPGCVVTDLRMPGMDGLELQDALGGTGSMLPVVFLTGQGSIPSAVEAMKHGAEDVLTKQSSRNELLAAIDRALEKSDLEAADRSRRAAVRSRFADLSARETEVLRLVAHGLLNKQIAAELGICERTVKFHRTAITTKLAVHSAAELALLAREAGLLDPTCPKGQ